MAAFSSPSPGPNPMVETQPSATATPLQVDEEPNEDSDSSYSVSRAGKPNLLNQFQHLELQNGRRYHAFREGTYLVPNDEEEQTRMDLVHHIYSLLLDGKLFLAPIGSPSGRVLDLGTGTGIWAIDFADENPSAEVLGTDLSPIQPGWTPPNCIFEVDDFEAEWLYHTPFDFIHARELQGCISNDDRFFKQALKHLTPGGYFEIQGVAAPFLSDDGTAEKAVNAQLWLNTLCEGAAKFGKPLDSAPLWKTKMEAAGFVEIHEEVRKIPIGKWPKDPKLKEIGRFQAIQAAQAIESYTPQIFSNVLGWSQEEIQVFMAKAKNEIKDPSVHLYFPVHILWGRRASLKAE
ncbi:Ff.00g108840.m01.CDS01 [Fusarium sp. VM40]|nr:Ff.00g108840.m01.CDS01 [Fusarium sp. VM40]